MKDTIRKGDYLGGLSKPPGKGNYSLNECGCGCGSSDKIWQVWGNMMLEIKGYSERLNVDVGNDSQMFDVFSWLKITSLTIMGQFGEHMF